MPCTDAVNTSPLLRAVVPATTVAVLLAGCGADRSDPPAASSSQVATSAAPQPTTAPPTITEPPPTSVAPSTEPMPSPSSEPPATPLACANEDLGVAAGPVSEEGALRRVDVTFT